MVGRVRRFMLAGSAIFVSSILAPAAHAQQPTTLAAALDHGASAAHVSVDVDDEPLMSVLQLIARQAGLTTAVNWTRVPKDARVTMHVKNVPVNDAYAMALRGTGLVAQFRATGNVTIVRDGEVAAADSMTGSVSGRIIDSASGRGLGEVTVHVQGEKRSVTSTADGSFTVHDVAAGEQVLTVRLFGYRSVTRVVTIPGNGRTAVRILMNSVPTVLSGVVTTATGTQRKLEVGNDITTLNVDSIRQVTPITSVTDLLETRVPGLTVLHSSGTPGDPARLRLRGAGSITGNNDPIVIVNGVRVYAAQSDSRNTNLVAPGFAAPSPLDQIDPNSIQTIEVFKGPSASSLYGSDAANGVIVITTKQGRAGPTHWNAELGAGLNYEPGDWPVNYYRFGYGKSSTRGSPLCAWNDLSCTVDSIVAFQALNDPRYGVFADHGSDQTAALTVSGGVSTLTYSLTGSASNTRGILKLPAIEQDRYQKFYNQPAPNWTLRPDQYKTYGGTGQFAAQPNATLRVTLNSSLFHSAQQRSSLEQALRQIEGSYIIANQLGQAPLVTGTFQRVTDEQLSWTNAVSANWQPFAWLPLTGTAGLNSITRTDESLVPYGVNSAGSLNTGSSVNAGDTTGSYGIGRGSALEKTMTIGTLLPVAGGRLTTAVGFNATGQSTSDFSATTDQLSPGVNRPSAFPDSGSHFSQSVVASSTYGWYVEPRLNVLSRFFVSPGFRLDGGSASGSQAGLTSFPKIDLSYVAVDRQDEAPVGGVLSLFRPRIAFGYAGVQPGPTEKLRLLTPDCPMTGGGCTRDASLLTLNGTTLVPGVFLTTLGNTKLRPERSSELEGGFDAELWAGRVQLTTTQYDKIRHDALIQLPVAASVYGPTDQWVNIGVIRNTGTEVSLTAQLFESRLFSWHVNTQWSHNSNRVVRLNAGFQPNVSTDGTGVVPGYPLFGRFAVPIAAYADVNQNGVIDANEVEVGDSLVYVGSTDPKYQLTANTGMTLGGRLSVSATIAYENGLNQFNTGAQGKNGAFSLLPNKPGTSLATQAAVVAATSLQSQIGLMQTVNTLRFQSLSVNYALPPAVAHMFRVPRASVALQGSNLGLHTNYHGKDPNVNAFSTATSAGDQVQDSGQLPQPRVWWLKFTLGN